MKTLKKTILTLSFLLIAFILVKAERPNKVEENANDVLIKYIENIMTGQDYDLNKLLADDFKQYINCDKKQLNYDKKKFIKHLKLTKNIVLQCKTNYSIIEDTEGFVIAKVDMQFASFTRTNYVTLSNTADGWKIINIVVQYS
jgi:hypothetical protein